MVKRNDKTNTGEGGKGKKGRTVSDDAGVKSLSDTSTSEKDKRRTKNSEPAKVQEDLYGEQIGNGEATMQDSMVFHTIADYL
jgi:hypothetical protein